MIKYFWKQIKKAHKRKDVQAAVDAVWEASGLLCVDRMVSNEKNVVVYLNPRLVTVKHKPRVFKDSASLFYGLLEETFTLAEERNAQFQAITDALKEAHPNYVSPHDV